MMKKKKKNVIANVHSGWKGTVQKIASKTIDKMQEKYGCNPNQKPSKVFMKEGELPFTVLSPTVALRSVLPLIR